MEVLQISEYEKRLLEGIQHEVNTTYHPPLVSVSLALALPYLLLMFITTLVAIVGNVLIMAAFCVSKRVSVVGNEFILNLAVADLLIAVFANPFRMLGVTAGEAWFVDRGALCEAVASVCLTSCICAFLTLTAITINRYVYVCHGGWYNAMFSRTKCIILCILCWVAAILFESANFLGWGGHKFDYKHNMCMWDRTKSFSYTLFLAVVLIGTPILVMFMAYSLIFLEVRKTKRRLCTTASIILPSVVSFNWWETVKSVRAYSLVLVAFTLTWGPYAIVNAVDMNDTFSVELHLYVSCFAHMHTCVNCIIYGLSNTHFRYAYAHVLGFRRTDSTANLQSPISVATCAGNGVTESPSLPKTPPASTATAHAIALETTEEHIGNANPST